MTRSELQQLIRTDADPTLDVDDLAELFPGEGAQDELGELFAAQGAQATDSTLAVNALGDLFPDHRGGETDDDSVGDDLGFAATPCVEAQDDMVYPDSGPESQETLDLEQLFPGEEGQSEIQRAATEFQQFARSFHAFATECQTALAFSPRTPSTPR